MNSKMDKIVLKNIEIFAHHGVYDKEKENGQKFFLTIEMALDLKKAGKSDDLSETVNYGFVCEQATSIFRRKSFNLIESAALEVAEHILDYHRAVKEVTVSVGKPDAPIDEVFETVEASLYRSWHRVYIGLGSNMGDKEENISLAVALILGRKGCRLVKESSRLITEPWGKTDQDDFCNSVLAIDTYLEPHELLEELLRIEKEMGRERKEKWGPRIIDLDILLYDHDIIYEEDLIIPHPLMHDREFVLKPMTEIAPYVIHPVFGKSMFELSSLIEG